MFVQLRMVKRKKVIRKSLRQKMDKLESLSKDELIAIIKAQQQDFATLNQIHNSRACRANWCRDYERNQRRYNKGFLIFQLQGRTRDDVDEEPSYDASEMRELQRQTTPHYSFTYPSGL